ncbi:MAG: histidine phosphatase family protein [Solirubrobacteraceae bacterium]
MSPSRYPTLALLRHGEPLRGKDAGRDPGLSPRGGLQARSAAEFLAALQPERYVASPARRSAATAEAIAGGRPVELDAALRGLELGGGDEGPLRALDVTRALFAQPQTAPFGGESLELLAARTLPAIQCLLDDRRDAVVVAHRVVNTVVLGCLLGLPLRSALFLQHDTGAVNLIEQRSERPIVAGINISPMDPILSAPASRVLPDSDTTISRRVYLVRHGAAANVGDDGALVARTPTPLTAEGADQAHVLGKWFANHGVTRVYASDIPRAMATATAIAGQDGVEAVRGLREIRLGDAGRASVQHLFARHPGYLTDPEIAPEGGESSGEAGERGRRTLDEILAADPSQDVVVVAHGGLNRALAASLLGWPMHAAFSVRCDFGSVTILEQAEGEWWLRTMNWTPGGLAPRWQLPAIPGLADRHAALVGR